MNESAMNSQTLLQEQVLIVGCGDIGERLALLLQLSDYAVTGLRRNPPRDSTQLRYKRCDVTDISQITNELKNPYDVIVLSMTPATRSDEGYEQAYVRTAQNLVDALAQQDYEPRLIVFISSTAVYNQTDGSWVDETSPTEPESFSGKRLLEAERAIQNSGFAHTIVRYSGIYGPGRNRLIQQVVERKASASEHFTNRIHADDCARVLAHLITAGREGRVISSMYLASDSMPVPMYEVVGWLAEQTGITNFISTEATNERGNKRCSNQRLLASGFRLQYPTYKDGYAAMLRDFIKAEEKGS